VWGGVRGNERSFSLIEEKRRVLKQLVVSTKKFKTFFLTNPLADQLLTQLLLYMTAKLQWQGVEHISAKARLLSDPQKAEEARNIVSGRNSMDFKREMQEALTRVAPVYAHIVMQCSDHSNIHRDRVFFESLYEATAHTILFSLQGLVAGSSDVLGNFINVDLGRFFRTDYYNINLRRSKGEKMVDILTVSELYELRHLDDQQEMSAELLASLHDRTKETGLHDSYGATSGTISKLLNRTQVKAQGALPGRHFEKTLMELHLEPPPPDPSKNSNVVPGASASDLRFLEDLRMQLLGRMRPGGGVRTTRMSMAASMVDPSTLRPSLAGTMASGDVATGGHGADGRSEASEDSPLRNSGKRGLNTAPGPKRGMMSRIRAIADQMPD